MFTSPTGTSPSLFLGGVAIVAVRTTEQDHPSWMKLGDPCWVDSQMEADNSLNPHKNC